MASAALDREKPSILFHASDQGEQSSIEMDLPEASPRIVGWNETLGVVCLAGTETLSVVNLQGERVNTLNLKSLLSGTESDENCGAE